MRLLGRLLLDMVPLLLVLDQLAELKEGNVAPCHIAFVGLVLVVDLDHVFLVELFFLKFQVAVFALQAVLLRVDEFDVALKVLLAGEAHHAPLVVAHEGLWVAGVRYFVSLEVLLSLERLAADGAGEFLEL